MTSILKVDNLQDASGTGTPYITGAVLQVKQTLKTNAFNTASTSFVDVTGLSVNITPSSTSSNVLIKVSLGALSMGGSPFLI